MAIAEMEKLTLTFKARHLDAILQMLQGFQGVHIETGYESSIPSAKKLELDKDIRNIEKNLQEIQSAQSILKSRESGHFMDFLKDGEEKRLSISELTEAVEESNWEQILEEVIHTDRRLTDNRTRRQEVTRLLNDLKIWEQLNASPLDFKNMQRVSAYFGSVHKMHAGDFTENLAKCEEDGVYYETVAENMDRVYFFLVCHKSMDDKLNIIINEFSYSTEEYRFDKPQQEVRDDLVKEEQLLLEDEKEIGELIVEQA